MNLSRRILYAALTLAPFCYVVSSEPKYILSSSPRCPDGASAIASKADCEAAALLLDLRKTEPAEIARPEAPEGCYKDGAAHVFFNSAGTGDSVLDDVRALCAWSARPEPPEEEQLGYLGTCKPDADDADHALIPERAVEPAKEPRVAFDARTEWPFCFNTSTRSQGACGSCWAFATASVVRQRACVEDCRTNKRCNEENVLHGRHLSVQHIMSCSSPESTAGCQGGLAHQAYKSMQKTVAWDYEAPYVCGGGKIEDQFGRGTTKTCTKWPWGTDVSATCTDNNEHLSVTKYYRLPSQTSAAARMAAELVARGPLAVDFCVRNNFFAFWKQSPGRIYTDAHGCKNGDIVGGHMVMLIGFGTKQQDGVDLAYWTLQNSWGDGWGHDGFFYMERGVNLCGIENKATAVDVIVSSEVPPPPPNTSSTPLTSTSAPPSTTPSTTSALGESADEAPSAKDIIFWILLILVIVGFSCWFLTCLLLCWERRRHKKQTEGMSFLNEPQPREPPFVRSPGVPVDVESGAPPAETNVPRQQPEVFGRPSPHPQRAPLAQDFPPRSEEDIKIGFKEERPQNPWSGASSSAAPRRDMGSNPWSSSSSAPQKREASAPQKRAAEPESDEELRAPKPMYSDNIKVRMEEERRKSMY